MNKIVSFNKCKYNEFGNFCKDLYIINCKEDKKRRLIKILVIR